MHTLYIESITALKYMLQEHKQDTYSNISCILLNLDDGALQQMNINRSDLSHYLRSKSVPSKTAIIFLERNGKHSSMSHHFKGVSHGHFNH